MARTTTASLPPAVERNLSSKLLITPAPYTIHSIPAMKKSRPAHAGTVEVFRRYNRLDPATVALGNTGVAPPSQTLTAVDINAKIEFYGTYLEIHEQVTLTNEDPVLNAATERLGVNLRETEDQLVMDTLKSTGSMINCQNGNGTDNPTTVSGKDLDKVINRLIGSNGKMFTEGIPGEDREGTTPVRSAYFAMCNTDLIPGLEGVGGFVSKWNYPNPSKTLDSEWGTYKNVRFLVSSAGAKSSKASAQSKDVYDIFVVARESYACIDQDNYSTRLIYRSPSYSNALELYSTIGWKMAFASKILNDQWVIRLRCTK